MADKDERTDTGLTDVLLQSPAQEQGCMVRVAEGADQGAELDLPSGAAVIGTRDDCDLTLTDSAVSGRHLQLEVTSDGIVAVDLGSTNGTFYMETRVERAIVKHGASLRIGRTRLVLLSKEVPIAMKASTRTSYGALVGSSPAIRRLYAVLEQLEAFESSTLILGETGVGKELVAREIHAHSKRARGPFEVCDCGALSPTLIESELFGHTKGAFTGAHADHRGVFERGDRGTVFLDEIGELPAELQPKLLRVLDTHALRRVGGTDTFNVDVRVVAATNRDLGALVKSGKFRQDLFYRLEIITVRVPALRERREDVPLLIEHFLRSLGQGDLTLSPTTVELFATGYDWPGNIRELKNAVERVRTIGALPENLDRSGGTTGRADGTSVDIDIDGPFQEAKRRLVTAFEHDYLEARIKQSNNNISQAARSSGMERSQFKRLLRKHGLLGSDDGSP
ncbi:MAG: sigma-54-dependent Fis family transcriptional regulator [Deltaproteobacteria bacterium]|nr:sigma-54-dependent Fis family transcriptional regulator [Deltaproteobacteria bacterium]